MSDISYSIYISDYGKREIKKTSKNGNLVYEIGLPTFSMVLFRLTVHEDNFYKIETPYSNNASLKPEVLGYLSAIFNVFSDDFPKTSFLSTNLSIKEI